MSNVRKTIARRNQIQHLFTYEELWYITLGPDNIEFLLLDQTIENFLNKLNTTKEDEFILITFVEDE